MGDDEDVIQLMTARMEAQKADIVELVKKRLVPNDTKIVMEIILQKATLHDSRAITNISRLLEAVDFFVDDATFHIVIENLVDRYGPSRRYYVQPCGNIPTRKYPRFQIVPQQCAIANDLRDREIITEKDCMKLISVFWKLAAHKPENEKQIERHAENIMLLGDVILDASVLQRVLLYIRVV